MLILLLLLFMAWTGSYSAGGVQKTKLSIMLVPLDHLPPHTPQRIMILTPPGKRSTRFVYRLLPNKFDGRPFNAFAKLEPLHFGIYGSSFGSHNGALALFLP
jgi:hypothetical protein